MRTYYPKEQGKLPHVFLTSDIDWVTSVFDHTEAEYDFGLILFCIHKNLNLIEILICKDTMLTRLVYNASRFAIYVILPMMKIMKL